MRVLIVILIIAIVIIIAAVATGFLNVTQIRGGKAPQVSATRNGVTAKGGQPPAFDVETGSVKVGTKETTVKMPTVVVQKPGPVQNEVVTNNAM
jgi:hypothetical protein